MNEAVNPSRTGRARPWPVIAWASAILLGAILGSVGCRSLPKSDLERRLLEIPKNEPFEALERVALRMDVDGDGNVDEEPSQLVYSFVPTRRPGGSIDGVPVVLVHGTPSTLFTWTEIIHGGSDFEGLTATHDVYAIEVVGHGVAPGAAAPCGFQRCARFVSAALDALGLEQVHLVGSSYGGEFVWRAALDTPARVRSLTLLDSSGYARRDQDWLPEEELMRDSSLAKLGWLVNSRSRIESALAPHFDGIPPGRVEEFFLVCENAINWKAMVDLARDENGDRQDEVPRLEPPTLVVWGAKDLAYPLEVYGERFAREIPGARLRVLEDCGHYPHEQRPAEVVDALVTFYADLEGGS